MHGGNIGTAGSRWQGPPRRRLSAQIAASSLEVEFAEQAANGVYNEMFRLKAAAARLRLHLLAPALLLVIAVVACSSDADPTATATSQASAPPATSTSSPSSPDPTATNSPAPTATSAPAVASFPVEIDHKYGSTTIDEAPERIVLVGLVEQDALLAMGVVPVATKEWFGGHPGALHPWAQDALGDAPMPEVLEAGELDFEKIASLRPDVIIGLYSGTTEEEYDTLSQIAPTVAQPGEYVNWGIPWPELTRTLGKIIGKTAEAESLVSGVEQSFANARAANPEFDDASGVVAAGWALPETTYAYASEDARGRFMEALGFKTPDEINELAGDSFFAGFSPERMDLLESDLLVWLAEPEQPESIDTYRQLDVFLEDRDIFLNDGHPATAAMSFQTVLSLPFALDQLVPEFSDALNASLFPVTIEHKFGSTTIDEKPERVLSLGFSEQDAILSLGVKPIAIRDWFGDQPSATWPWAHDKLEGAEPQVLNLTFGELDFELLASLNPDLIVATHSGITAEEYATLEQIAPTLAQSGDYGDFGMPWQEQTLSIGKAVGKEKLAQALVADVENQIAAIAAANPEFSGLSMAMAAPADEGQYWLYGPITPPVLMLDSLGFAMPQDVADTVGEQNAVQISSEQMALFDVDVIIWYLDSEEERTALKEHPLYGSLRVSREDREIIFTEPDDLLRGAFSFSTVLSLPFALELLEPRLKAAIDGDPETEVAPAS